MKNKPLYELNLPPAAFFIGQYVRVVTSIQERDENGEIAGQISVVGLVVESDSVYLTLGTVSPLDETLLAQLAIKHEDIQMIRVQNPDETDEDILTPGGNSLN